MVKQTRGVFDAAQAVDCAVLYCYKMVEKCHLFDETVGTFTCFWW